MSDDRLLGELLANQKNLHEDVTEIKRDVKALNEFRWKWLGRAGAYTSLVALIVTIITEYLIYH
jgi:hypothetical protein